MSLRTFVGSSVFRAWFRRRRLHLAFNQAADAMRVRSAVEFGEALRNCRIVVVMRFCGERIPHSGLRMSIQSCDRDIRKQLQLRAASRRLCRRRSCARMSRVVCVWVLDRGYPVRAWRHGGPCGLFRRSRSDEFFCLHRAASALNAANHMTTDLLAGRLELHRGDFPPKAASPRGP